MSTASQDAVDLALSSVTAEDFVRKAADALVETFLAAGFERRPDSRGLVRNGLHNCSCLVFDTNVVDPARGQNLILRSALEVQYGEADAGLQTLWLRVAVPFTRPDTGAMDARRLLSEQAATCPALPPGTSPSLLVDATELRWKAYLGRLGADMPETDFTPQAQALLGSYCTLAAP